MDKIKAIEAFMRVVDTGGITRAADMMDAPKATISTLIQELEAQLGGACFTARPEMSAEQPAHAEATCASDGASCAEPEAQRPRHAKQSSTPTLEDR